MRRYQVFINQDAGSVRETDQQARDITTAFDEAGVDANVSVVDPQVLPDRMRAAWQSGIDAVVVAGGDGTISCAAGVAVEHEIVLGVLPMGTFNHFAKDLGMKADLGAAVRFLAEAEVSAIDVGDVNGRVFVNNVSIGVYPTMVGEREAIRRRRGWGKIRAVPVAVIRTLRRLPVYRLVVTFDVSPPITVTTPLLFVGNGLFDERGERVGQRTSLSDHRLSVYVIATTSTWRLITNALEARVRGINAAPQMERHAVHTVVINSRESLAIALDGEAVELDLPLTLQSRVGALRVLAAPEATPT